MSGSDRGFPELSSLFFDLRVLSLRCRLGHFENIRFLDPVFGAGVLFSTGLYLKCGCRARLD